MELKISCWRVQLYLVNVSFFNSCNAKRGFWVNVVTRSIINYTYVWASYYIIHFRRVFYLFSENRHAFDFDTFDEWFFGRLLFLALRSPTFWVCHFLGKTEEKLMATGVRWKSAINHDRGQIKTWPSRKWYTCM